MQYFHLVSGDGVVLTSPGSRVVALIGVRFLSIPEISGKLNCFVFLCEIFAKLWVIDRICGVMVVV
jgi:hypothetical protein